MQKIRFQNNEYLLIDGKAIATEDQYRHGLESFALLKGQTVMRHGKDIGTKNDIKFMEEIDDIKLAPDALENMLECAIKKIECSCPVVWIANNKIDQKELLDSRPGKIVKFERYAPLPKLISIKSG